MNKHSFEAGSELVTIEYDGVDTLTISSGPNIFVLDEEMFDFITNLQSFMAKQDMLLILHSVLMSCSNAMEGRVFNGHYLLKEYTNRVFTLLFPFTKNKV